MDLLNDYGGKFQHMSLDNDGARSLALQSDIELVMKIRFDSWASGAKIPNDSEEYREYWATLHKTGQGQKTFLWVYLMFEAWETEPLRTPNNWRRLMKLPPGRLYELYECLLDTSTRADLIRIRILLNLMLSTRAPLTLDAAIVVIAIRLCPAQDARPADIVCGELLRPADFRNWISQACGFFILVTGDNLEVFHQSGKQFLLRSSEQRADAAETSKRKPGKFEGSFSTRYATY